MSWKDAEFCFSCYSQYGVIGSDNGLTRKTCEKASFEPRMSWCTDVYMRHAASMSEYKILISSLELLSVFPRNRKSSFVSYMHLNWWCNNARFKVPIVLLIALMYVSAAPYGLPCNSSGKLGIDQFIQSACKPNRLSCITISSEVIQG